MEPSRVCLLIPALIGQVWELQKQPQAPLCLPGALPLKCVLQAVREDCSPGPLAPGVPFPKGAVARSKSADVWDLIRKGAHQPDHMDGMCVGSLGFPAGTKPLHQDTALISVDDEELLSPDPTILLHFFF